MQKKARYELVVVYPTSENESLLEKEVAERCKKFGFKVVSLDKWGVRTLAYDIKKEQKGIYLKFEIEGGEAAKLDRDLSLEDKLLRYLLVKINS